MRFSTAAAAIAAVATLAEAAGRPSNTSICDYYTTALLKNNTAANQYTVLTLLVNTVVIGNYTKPNIPGITFPDVAVPGILAPATINGTKVELLPYFNGMLASTNNGGSSGVPQNFLDGGGATPLMNNKPADDTTSNQYMLLTHLYQYFGTALGCSQQGMSAFPAYQGVVSQYSVHKYMALGYADVTYFIEQVGLAASSFGVSDDDVKAVGGILEMYFDVRCAAATQIIPSSPAVLNSICIDSTCPEAANASCSSYGAVVQPMSVNSTSNSTMSMSGASSTMMSGSMTSTMTGTMTGSTAGATTGAAVKNAAGGIAAAMAAAAIFL